MCDHTNELFIVCFVLTLSPWMVDFFFLNLGILFIYRISSLVPLN